MKCSRIPAVLACLAVLAGAVFTEVYAADPPRSLLLIGSAPDTHPPTTHEYLAGMKLLEQALKPIPELAPKVIEADPVWKDGPDHLSRADGAVLFLTEGAKWLSDDPKRLAAFQNLAKRRGSLICLHWGMGTRLAEPVAPFVNLFGACHGGPDRKHKVVTARVTLAEPLHPVATAMNPFQIKEEFYYALKTPKTGPQPVPIIHAHIDGKPEMVAWAWERPDGGRSFGFSGLHFHENWKNPEYRRLVIQGIAWANHVPIPPKGLPIDLPESAFALPDRK